MHRPPARLSRWTRGRCHASSDELKTLDLQEMANAVGPELLDVRERGAEELGDLHPQRLELGADHG